MDRGRLLLGLALVVPFGVLAPAIGRPGGNDLQPAAWSVASLPPNPISVANTPRDVLANLTNRTVTPTVVGGSPKQVLADTKATAAAGEIGSDRDSTAGSDAAAPGPPPTAVPGIARYAAPPGATHIFPVANGAAFTDEWGGPRPGELSHQGTDLFAPVGTAVVAVSDGVLSRVGWSPTGGWRVWLRDPWGNEFYYAHLTAFAPVAKQDAKVAAGTVIGFVGTSGDAQGTPAHLHFEIHPEGGDATPPFPYLNAWPRVPAQ